MEYSQRLSILQNLQEEIHQKLTQKTSDNEDQQKLEEYHQILKQIEAEIHRIDKMRSYNPGSIPKKRKR